MSESLRSFDEIAAVNLDYFYGKPERAKDRQEYIDRGLIPTNNLCMYFFDNSQEDMMPGLHNPYDYRYQPFGQVIHAFRESNPDLWEEAKLAAEESSDAMGEYADLLFGKRDEIQRDLRENRQPPVEIPRWKKIIRHILRQADVAPPEPNDPEKAEMITAAEIALADPVIEEKGREAQELRWKSATVFTRVFKILAPQLEAAGIDPLDVCR